MADYQLGNNLYGNDQGQYWSVQNGPYRDGTTGQMMNGQYRDWQTSPWDTSQSQINSMYGAQQKQQVDQLNQQKQAALGGINQQQAASNQGFYNQRNQADVTNAQNVQRMREVMAQNGLNTSGENITATAGLNAQRQGAFNDINQKQSQANAGFDQQRADANAKYDPQNVIDQINAQKSQALMQAFHDYLSRMDAQRAQYIQGQQFDATKAMQQQQFDATQAMDKYQADQNMAYKNAASGFQGNAGGGGTSAGVSGPATFQSNLAEANRRGLDPADNAALSWIVQHESGFDPNAKNSHSTAFGYGQFLNSTVKDYQKKMGLDYSNPVNQLLMTEQYMKDRYGGAAQAVNFWKQHGWY